MNGESDRALFDGASLTIGYKGAPLEGSALGTRSRAARDQESQHIVTTKNDREQQAFQKRLAALRAREKSGDDQESTNERSLQASSVLTTPLAMMTVVEAVPATNGPEQLSLI